MKYDFDNIANRRNTASCKWSCKDTELPMWIADMDFKAPDFILNSLKKTISIENFGYNDIPNEFFESYKTWWKNRHNFDMDISWMIFSTGVVPTISSAVRKITTPAEKVLVTKPCYNIFFNSIVNNGRTIVSSDLIYENNEYHLDFSDLEKKMADPQVTLMILCNPENPTGHLWTREELVKIGELAYQNNVIVLSDEIHCDIVENGYNYIPFASVNEINRNNSITCISASKCFSLAGLQGSMVVVPNPNLRHKIWRGLNTDEVAEANSFVCNAQIEAFNNGEEWIKELNDYIKANRDYVVDYISNNIPNLTVTKTHSLYLIWVNTSKVCGDASKLCSFIRENTGLWITPGDEYGECGNGFVRINLATSRTNVVECMQRLKKGIELFNK